MSNKTLELIQTHQAEWVDFRFTDTLGKVHHIAFPAATLDTDAFGEGTMFDGSSIHGWTGIEASDMTLLPDDSTAAFVPCEAQTLEIVRCAVVEPSTLTGSVYDPRSLAHRAEEYLKSTGIADTAFFGPEPEFFVFDSVEWQNDMNKVNLEIHSDEGAWSSSGLTEGKNTGHRPRVKGGYFPVPPVDSLQTVRGDMCMAM